MTNASATNTRPLLVELLTEELPPKALQKLGLAFAEGLRKTLEQHNLLASDCSTTDFSTPRRLAVRMSAVLAQAPEIGRASCREGACRDVSISVVAVPLKKKITN